MVSDLTEIISDSAKGMKRSAIRELLKLTQRPEIISFAGGLPAKETFPIEELVAITKDVLENDGATALQYGSTEGDPALLNVLVDRYNNQGLNITKDNLCILTSSQQALDLVGKIFCNPGDKVIVGLPSYLGGLGAFTSYGAEPVGILHDEKGMRADLLEKNMAELCAAGKKPKFIYVIPDFQNPAGITMPLDRRIEILAIAKKYEVLVVEDSPYRELRFEGEAQPMLYELDNKEGNVMTFGTFSKIFVPGFRIGWILANPRIVDYFVKAKQNTDLCTSAFVQKIAAKYIEQGLFDKNLKAIVEMYREKKAVMIKAFEDFMPKEVTWTNPEGGLFLFLKLPEGYDAEDLFNIAIKKNVAFVLGSVFHCDGSGKNTMRMNFSYVTKEQSLEGIKRLAEAVNELVAIKNKECKCSCNK
jgi:2-aminoadipate transaminase